MIMFLKKNKFRRVRDRLVKILGGWIDYDEDTSEFEAPIIFFSKRKIGIGRLYVRLSSEPKERKILPLSADELWYNSWDYWAFFTEYFVNLTNPREWLKLFYILAIWLRAVINESFHHR